MYFPFFVSRVWKALAIRRKNHLISFSLFLQNAGKKRQSIMKEITGLAILSRWPTLGRWDLVAAVGFEPTPPKRLVMKVRKVKSLTLNIVKVIGDNYHYQNFRLFVIDESRRQL